MKVVFSDILPKEMRSAITRGHATLAGLGKVSPFLDAADYIASHKVEMFDIHTWFTSATGRSVCSMWDAPSSSYGRWQIYASCALLAASVRRLVFELVSSGKDIFLKIYPSRLSTETEISVAIGRIPEGLPDVALERQHRIICSGIDKVIPVPASVRISTEDVLDQIIKI